MPDQNKSIFIGYTTRLFGEGLGSIVRGFENFNLVDTVPIGKELFKNLSLTGSDEILILEINCPGKRDLDHIKELIKSFPLVKVLLLSMLPRKDIGIQLLDSGISGYLLKSCGEADLLSALNKIIDNKPYFCSDITQNLFTGKNKDQVNTDITLSDREKEVLSLLVNNHTNKQIALKLNLSENTVKTHRRNIHSKFGVSNLLGLVRYACRANLIDFGDDGYCPGPYVN